MKKIIDGRRYDTDTAKAVGSYSNDLGFNDFDFIRETLYQKRTGEFFLYGKGGARTRYSETVGQNTWAAGERIVPLDFEDAREWAEKCLSADTYEEIFGPADEGGEKETIGLSLHPSTVKKLRNEAGRTGQTMSDVVADLIESIGFPENPDGAR